MGNKVKKSMSIQFEWFLCETQKYNVLGSKFIFDFFTKDHIHNVVLTLPNVEEVNVEIDNAK